MAASPTSSGPLGHPDLTFDDYGDADLRRDHRHSRAERRDARPSTMTGTTQLATAFTPMNVAINGNAPSSISGIDIDNDGTVYATYENGSRVAAYRIPLANVPSPDNLEPVPGDAYAITTASGDVQIGFPTEGGRGTLVSGALEQSNVDMASELTDMIVAQRDYTANSKVVQTSSELLDVLMNLKR